MRWEKPEPPFDQWSVLLAAWLFLGSLVFLMVWTGYGNSTWPKGWGDPISFSEALSHAPRIFGNALVAGLAILLLTGIRSGR